MPKGHAFELFDGTSITQRATASGYNFVLRGGATFFDPILEILRVATPPTAVTGQFGGYPDWWEIQPTESLAALEAASLDGWFWEPALGGTLWVKVPKYREVEVNVSME